MYSWCSCKFPKDLSPRQSSPFTNIVPNLTNTPQSPFCVLGHKKYNSKFYGCLGDEGLIRSVRIAKGPKILCSLDLELVLSITQVRSSIWTAMAAFTINTL